MRTTFLVAAAFSILSATPLSATPARAASEPEVPTSPRAAVTESLAGPRAAGELRLTRVELEKRAGGETVEAAAWPERGSFWWMVGVVVVGGVILAVIL